ncbi:MAG: 16S rRNA (cytidine(1402)-2'-O)-methyltransferase, partial [Acidobacteriota bacterium]
GASAVMAALSAAGVEGEGFTFLGFPPTKAKDRTRWFERFRKARIEVPVVFFEAPHRVLRTLGELAFLSNDQLVVFRELTKLHETVYRGTPQEIIAALTMVAGEFTVVAPVIPDASSERERPPDDEVVRLFGQITDKRGREAAREVAEATGLSANEVYEIVRRAKN